MKILSVSAKNQNASRQKLHTLTGGIVIVLLFK